MDSIFFYISTGFLAITILFQIIILYKHYQDSKLQNSQESNLAIFTIFFSSSLMLFFYFKLIYEHMFFVNQVTNLMEKILLVGIMSLSINYIVIIRNKYLKDSKFCLFLLYIFSFISFSLFFLPTVFFQQWALYTVLLFNIVLSIYSFIKVPKYKVFLSFLLIFIGTLFWHSKGFNYFSLLKLIILCLMSIDLIFSYTNDSTIFRKKSFSDLFRKSIFYKLIFLFTVLITIALTFTTFTILTLNRNSLIQSQSQAYYQVSMGLKEEAEQFIVRATSLLNGIKNNKNILHKNEYTRGTYLYDQVRSNKSLDKLFLFTPNGEITSVADIKSLGVKEVDEDIQKEIINSLEYNKRFQKYTTYLQDKIFLSIPIFNFQGQYLASLAGVFNLDGRRGMFMQIKESTNLNIDVLDSNYFSVLNQNQLSANDPLREINSELISLQKTILDEEKYLVVVVKDNVLGLSFFTIQPEKIALEGIYESERRALIILFLGITIFSFLGLWASVLIQKPLNEIEKGLESFRKGDFDYQIKIKNIDEFGDLATALNQMSQDIKNLFKYQAKSEKMTAITKLAISFNHEINNPLSAIMLANSVLKVKSPEEAFPGAKKLYESIELNSKRIQDIVKNSLEITEPIMEEYTDGTEMIKLNFTDTKKS
jgi:methyl-accepting chemotaxis protein